MSGDTMNEVTFVAWLGTVTELRYQRKVEAEEPVLIARGRVEERQVDRNGSVRRCDIRLASRSDRKLASGEMKRPEVPQGRDPENETLVLDARRKAVARGLKYYFTCNMAQVVLFEVGDRPGEEDRKVRTYNLAPIRHSREVRAYEDEISVSWCAFLDDLENRLLAAEATPPSVTAEDVIVLRNALYDIADEAIDRVVAAVSSDANLARRLRDESFQAFNFDPALRPEYRADFRRDLLQMLRFGAFVVAQKLLLYRVLQDSGPKRAEPFDLDPLAIPSGSTDPTAVRSTLTHAWAHAIDRSGDFETAFLPEPLIDLVFLKPSTREELEACRVGAVWAELQRAVQSASWASISRNLVGFLYETIVEPTYRHELGQFYTREDVVDLLVAFGVRRASDFVLDPASGGGSFLWSTYRRKRDLGDTHEQALEAVWAFEITAFAAELSTITLATTDVNEPAAYPRVLLRDFFDAHPGLVTDLEIPSQVGPVKIPEKFDAVIGNPPYISYRRQTNQAKVVNTFAALPRDIALPRLSGKSDAYVWFMIHATQFLKEGARLSFVISSAVLFTDYGIPLIRFLGHHYRIVAVVDSMVERWFPDADTNAVLVMAERCGEASVRRNSVIRFVRLRRPLGTLLPPSTDPNRRQAVEDLLDAVINGDTNIEDPRMTINLVPQGDDGGLEFVAAEDGPTAEEMVADDEVGG
ncbi:Eco57I restriction-modification methylase domain-containing protein [Actinomadura luteofluorescens]|uniref:Eco57I restriction-modification methylase domain-containing protein n=1 Tax=Actinomadura luteofluorescens TaxID=46163 RepID=UPI0030D26E70